MIEKEKYECIEKDVDYERLERDKRMGTKWEMEKGKNARVEEFCGYIG